MYICTYTFEVFSLIVPALDSSVTADTAAAKAEGSDSFQPKKSKPTTLTSLKIEMLVGTCTPAAVRTDTYTWFSIIRQQKNAHHTKATQI